MAGGSGALPVGKWLCPGRARGVGSFLGMVGTLCAYVLGKAAVPADLGSSWLNRDTKPQKWVWERGEQGPGWLGQVALSFVESNFESFCLAVFWKL